MKKSNLIFYLAALFLLSGCSNLKYLPKGEQLYVGGNVTVESDSISSSTRKDLEATLENLLRPKPNSSFLGLRPKLYFYNIAGEPKKDKGFKHWLKTKVGEPPVLFNQVDLDYNAKLLKNYAENIGYFNATTQADSTAKNRKVTAEYTVQPGEQYTIKSVSFPADSSGVTAAVANTKNKTYLQPGKPYSLDRIKAERVRIDATLKEEGYYYFSSDYLLVQVDSTLGNHQVSLHVKVKDDTPEQAKQTYTINHILLYPDYSLSADTLPANSFAAIEYNDFTIVDPQKKFKPKVFDEALLFHKGDLYTRTDHNKTLNRLVNLGVFQFVKNQFKLSDSIKNTLNVYYYMTPRTKKSLRVELKGKTNSANYAGGDINLSWRNRNTFRGAELLTISAYGGYEVQVSGQNNGYNVFKLGGETSLTWPRLVTPFNLSSSSAFVPKTKATLGYEFQSRTQLYSLNSFKGSFGYLWKENIRKEHQFNVMNITYVNPFKITQLYQDQIALNPSLGRVTERQFIFGPSYTFTYTNTVETAKKSTYYYQGGIDLSGNLVGLISGANYNNPSTIFGVAYSQYVKLDNDFRNYFKLNNHTTLASRFIAGIGLPYGNSRQLPFIKQFSAGGTNDIRAFRARSVGPGSYKADVSASSFLPDESGDIKLEFNTELRADLFSIVKGAIFVDAGNVWLLNKDPQKPGAKFSKNFLKEIAVGTGVGLRFDLSFLVLRTDLAFPLRKPYLPEGKRWVLNQVDFGSSQWRKENLVFNLAIGYPF